MDPSPDIIIVGAGATGLSFAWRLATQQPDLKILILERGGHIDQRQGPACPPIGNWHFKGSFTPTQISGVVQ